MNLVPGFVDRETPRADAGAGRGDGNALPTALRPLVRPLTVAACAVAYAIAFPPLWRALGPDVAMLFTIAVLPATLAYGLAGGLAAGAIAAPVHVALLGALGPEALAALHADWAGAVTGIGVGIAAGAGRDLVRRVRSQAAALEAERVRLEGEIQRRHETERALACANCDLVGARETAERAARAKNALLGRASHELRTPVAAILGYVELVREELAAGGAISLERDLERIHAAAAHLAGLLDDLLDVTRLDSGHFVPTIERVRVRDLVDGIATIATPLAARRGNRFAIDVADASLEVVTDRRRVEQIALNLLSNAAKFTENGTITLSAARAGEAFRLIVSDDGIGMTPEQASRAFDEFYRAAPGQTDGSGLGLAIALHLCDALGGSIAVRSSPGAGTTFVVTLPLAPASGCAAAVCAGADCADVDCAGAA